MMRNLHTLLKAQNRPETAAVITPAGVERRRRSGFQSPCALGILTAAALGLSGCAITINAPPEQPPVVGEAADPEVVEETTTVGFVEPTVDVEYVFIDGRYCYWHPYYHSWYYRPRGWALPPGAHHRVVANRHELGRGGREVQRQEPRRPEAREPQRVTPEHKNPEPNKIVKPSPQGGGSGKAQPAKKDEKKRN